MLAKLAQLCPGFVISNTLTGSFLFITTNLLNILQTNTFQMVLATDEVFTYAIFNYLEINWSSHTEAGGDTTTGEGGVPAYVSMQSTNTLVICFNLIYAKYSFLF